MNQPNQRGRTGSGTAVKAGRFIVADGDSPVTSAVGVASLPAHAAAQLSQIQQVSERVNE